MYISRAILKWFLEEITDMDYSETSFVGFKQNDLTKIVGVIVILVDRIVRFHWSRCKLWMLVFTNGY